MNVLFIQEVEWIKKVVFDIHMLSESLSMSGHQVYAIDYESAWAKNGPFDFGSLKTKEFANMARAFSEASVCLRRPGFIKIPGLSRLSATLTHYKEIRRTIEGKNIDTIMLYSIATNGLQAVHLARKFKIPVIFRSIDIVSQLVPYSPLRSLTKLLERRVYSSVDMVLTLTPKLSKYVIDLGAKENAVKLLLMPLDTRLFHPSADNAEIRHKWALGRKDLIVLFMGTLFEFTGLDSLIRQFPKIIEQVPEAKLLIVGDGPQRHRLESIISELALKRQVIITGFQPYETMPKYINSAAVCVNPFLITGATRDIFPGKIVQYLACAKPVIATPLSGLVAVTPGEEQGLVYASSPEEMAQKIIQLLKSSEYRERLGQNGVGYVRQSHSYESITRQLEARLEDAIRSRQNE